MADEPTPVEVEAPEIPDTPTAVDESGTQPEGGTPAEQPDDTNWEKRYKDLQSEYTRTTQEASELRRAQEQRDAEASVTAALDDPETQQAALDHLTEQLGEAGAKEWLEARGYELEASDDDDDEEFRDPRVDQLLEREQKKELDAQVAEAEAGMEKKLDELAEGMDLEKEARDLILDAAVAAPNQDGTPDVEGQFTRFKAALDAHVKAYRATKRNAPSPPVPGSSGTPNPSLNSSQDRLAAANAIADEAYAGS